jgi:NAD-dependent dihydropyrimidine dehydrogenase PreA subunit
MLAPAMQREIIRIDEELCNGCGDCVPSCAEGALQIIDGKVRLVGDLLCDGLGACIGQCPLGAISIEKREADPYDEAKVIADLVGKGRNTIVAHLRHLKDHGQTQFFAQGIAALRARQSGLGFDLDQALATLQTPPALQRNAAVAPLEAGCPGSRTLTFSKPAAQPSDGPAAASALRQWPIQLHLVNPLARYFQGADLLVAADCVAFAVGDFHARHLAGKSLVIACPKLDSHMEIYVDKIRQMVDTAGVKSITVMVMEVPCCGGLFQMVRQAVAQAARPLPVTLTVVGLQGEILSAETVV